MAEPVSTTVRGMAVPRLDHGAVGIHLAWSGPELSPLARGGYEIRRRPHRESKTRSVCARFDTARLARLSALGLVPDELGVMLLHSWRPNSPAAHPHPTTAVASMAINVPWSVFTQELTSPAGQISVGCSALSAFAIAISNGKSVASADVGPAAVTLTGQDIDTVVVYARQPTDLSVCAWQSADPAGDQKSWAGADVIASGLTLPLHETDPSLSDAAQELAKGRTRLVGTETLTADEAKRLAAALRPGVAHPSGRPCDRVLLDRADTDTPFQETVFSTRIGLLTLDPRLRRVLGFGFADTTAVAGQTYDYLVTGRFEPADLADRVYDVHQIPSGTALPAMFRIRDIAFRFGAPTRVVLDPGPDAAALSAVSRRGIAITAGDPFDGFVSWWLAGLSCVIDLPAAVQTVTFEVPLAHGLSCAGVLGTNPASVTPAPIPAGPSATVTFPAPVDQLRIVGSGTLYGLRLPEQTDDGTRSCICGPVQLAAQALPTAPPTLTPTNLQSPPIVLTGDITEQTPIADRPQPGFRLTWAPATLWGGGGWPSDLAADPATDSLAYQIEHRRVYSNGNTDPWEPIQADDNLTFGSWPASSGPPSLGYGADLDTVFPLHRQRRAGAAVTMSVTDVLSPDATTDPPRAAAPLGSSHQYRIRAMDVVGRVSGAWTESAVVRLEKHIPPPLPVGPQPEPVFVGTPPRPSAPMGVQVRTLLASDPGLSSADTQLLAGHQSAVVLSWGWRPAERELDPATVEFRVYVQPDIPTTIPGTITSVTQTANQWVLGFTTTRSLIADECAGQWLTSGGQAFRIVTHTDGTSVTVTVAASLITPATAPRTGPVNFGRPLNAGHQRPGSWLSRVAVVPLTDDDTYRHVFFDVLAVSAAAPTDEAWVGVSAADAESYVADEISAAQPNGGRPGNESSIAAVTAFARYRGRPDFAMPPPLGSVHQIVTDEPTGRNVTLTLDGSVLLGGAIPSGASVALDRCPLDAVLGITSLSGSDVVLQRADGTHQVVVFPNPSDEAAVRTALASDHPERLDTRYFLFLLGHFDSPQQLFSPTGALQSAGALSDQLPPKPGRYFYRVRLADASGAVSAGGAILPIVARVPSIAPMPAPTRRTVSVADGTLSVGLALESDPELAWVLLFYRVGDWATAPPDPADGQLLRLPNRRDLYPAGGLRLRLVDGTVLAPATAEVAAATTDSDGLLDIPISVTLPAGTAGQPRWLRYWCYALSRDGVPSRPLGPFTLPVGANS